MKALRKLLPSRSRSSAKPALQDARTNLGLSEANLQDRSTLPQLEPAHEPERAPLRIRTTENLEETELQNTNESKRLDETREVEGQSRDNEHGNRYGDIYIYGTNARAVLGNVIGNLEHAQATQPDDDLKCRSDDENALCRLS